MELKRFEPKLQSNKTKFPSKKVLHLGGSAGSIIQIEQGMSDEAKGKNRSKWKQRREQKRWFQKIQSNFLP